MLDASNLVFVLNGPNLNLLGTREPAVYGHDTLDDIAEMLEAHGETLGLTIDLRQSNHEGHLIDWLHEAGSRGACGVILNAGGLTHTSVALHDACRSITVPVVEVHLSNPQAREEFRHHSYISAAARGSIAGFGALGYRLALDAVATFRH
jgi:3-dehydroquinate dehydratase-2